MPPKKHGTTWKAEPHTIAKIKILEDYLVPWFQILGSRRHGQDLLFVDGFAGPGGYTNHPKGSPIAALVAARRALDTMGSKWVAGTIHCAFIEDDPERFARLQEHIKPFIESPGIKIHTLNKTFLDVIQEFKTLLPGSFSGSDPLFVFIDPFGPTNGSPFSVIVDILNSPTSEVLINLDADGIARIFSASSKVPKNIELLNDIFGDTSWRSKLESNMSMAQQCRAVRDHYIDKLRSLPRVGYVFPFEMSSTGNLVNYYLIFASQHALGLKKMKESMTRLAKDGSYRFSDSSVDQLPMFRSDDPEVFAPLLHQQFTGRRVRYDDLIPYTLNNTPFLNPKRMLLELEKGKLIEVTSSDPKRRAGKFPEEKIDSILFK